MVRRRQNRRGRRIEVLANRCLAYATGGLANDQGKCALCKKFVHALEAAR